MPAIGTAVAIPFSADDGSGIAPGAPAILLEVGTNMLLEDGTPILLE